MGMKKLKIAAAFLLPLILGIMILITTGKHIRAEINIEPLFAFWLVFIAACTGFVAGTQYPAKPFQAGALSGLPLFLILVFFVIWLSPLFAAPFFLLVLGAVIVAITGSAAFFGAVVLRTRVILAQERQAEVSDNTD